MKANTKMRLVILLALIFAVASIAQDQPKQTKLTTTTVADSKYGEGGTLETTSDQKAKLLKEVWKDKDGKIRETHDPNTGQFGEQWSFYKPDEQSKPVLVLNYITKTLYIGNFYKPIRSDVDRMQFQQWIEHVEKQFAKDGTITAPWDQTDTKVEQPTFTPKEIFKKSEDTKPESKPKEEKPSPAPSTTPSTAPGHKVDANSESGLYTVKFSTPEGNIKVNLTDDLAAGDTISGTVEEEPAGKTEKERSQSQSELNGYVIEFGQQQTRVVEQSFVRMIPTAVTAADRIIRLLRNGREVARAEVPISSEPKDALTGFVLPTGGQQGRLIQIKGPCNGRFAKTDFVKIGGTIIRALAESPRKQILRDTSDILGPTKIECHENDRVAECPFRNLGIKLSADKLSLLKGETTKLHVQVLGLAEINQDVPLDLVNNSPAVIALEGGVEQHITIYAKDGIANGTYSTDRTLTGIVRGGFSITGTVRWEDTCEDDFGGPGLRKQGKAGDFTFEFKWGEKEHELCKSNTKPIEPTYLKGTQVTKDVGEATNLKCDCKDCKEPCQCLLFQREPKPKDKKDEKDWVFKKYGNPQSTMAYYKGNDYKCLCIAKEK